MTPASKACMDRMLARNATYPHGFWDDYADAKYSGASRSEVDRLEAAARHAERLAREEAKRIRASFESGESWAES